MAKKNYDGKFVSSETHEINYVAKLFTDKNGEYIPTPFLHYLLYLMNQNMAKVSRNKLYAIIEEIGYTKNKK